MSIVNRLPSWGSNENKDWMQGGERIEQSID